MKIWDLLSGGKLLSTLSNHQKTITCLTSDEGATRVLTGSLDQQVKVYETQTWNVTHSFKMRSEVLSLALSPDRMLLAVGHVAGKLDIRKKQDKTELAAAAAKVSALAAFGGYGQPPPTDGGALTSVLPRAPRTGTRRFFNRGANAVADAGDFVVSRGERKQKLKAYDKDLKKFQYHTALDDALATKQAPVIVSVIEQLVQRRALILALSGRDQNSLEPILSFTNKQIDNPNYSSLLIDVVNIILDMYTCVVGRSIVVDELFMKLRKKVTDEVSLQKDAKQLLGMIELVLSSTDIANGYDENGDDGESFSDEAEEVAANGGGIGSGKVNARKNEGEEEKQTKRKKKKI